MTNQGKPSPFSAKLGDRELFPDLEPLVYANHAAISPPSWPVRRAVQNAMVEWGRRGVGAFPVYAAQRARVREKLGKLIGAPVEDIGFVPNTTHGVSSIALCFPWRRGDKVVVFEGEFPANVTPWLRAAELFGLEPIMLRVRDFAASDAQGLASLEGALSRGGVRLAAVSAVQFQTGLRMPLKEMATLLHAHGAELFVDGIQATGVLPIDVRDLGVDYWTAGGQKWLMGPEGTGFLYVRGERAKELRPHLAGWLSHEDGVRFLLEGPGLMQYDRPFKQRADVFEGGGPNTLGLVGLEAAVDLIAEIGTEKIFEHVTAWLDGAEAGLVERGFTSLRAPEPSRRSGILGVVPPSDVDVVKLHRAIISRGVSCAIPDGVLRLSPHWPNNVDEVEQVLLTVDEALADARGIARPRSDDW
ncbi:aminotransferase class V-fold PLP-dependent enzyme [Polyangium aurulentum]|uniref:aminotransferase class V-fold PLP-dependent enzyme n=1 Tax=Polyangium aurulentum TaxID=2567896 RepID=UPI0010ADB499|nr:aminotransferase class V-fold PLP-dependent enzyme [Polyangium aurulentum]UQA60205.1 aminotransferase class V-fold PLP-dependent enzyme [Polyangium aurulentum]